MHEQLKLAASAPVTLRRDVGDYLVFYLQENQDRFPGVTVQRVFVRRYPHGTLAAHILGNVGEVSEEQLKERPLPRPPAGRRDRPGRGRGHLRPLPPRAARGRAHPGRRPRPADPQRPARLPAAGAGRQPEALDRLQGAGSGRSGDGGSRPARGLHHDGRAQRRNPRARLLPDLRPVGLHAADDPGPGQRPLPRRNAGAADRSRDLGALSDRVDLQADHRDRGARKRQPDPERSDRRPRPARNRRRGLQERRRSGERLGQPGLGAGSVLGRLLLHARLDRMWNTGDLQHWAHALGIGRPTGIDLPGAAEGLLPSQQWRNQLYKEGETERPWSAGDNIQLATGQGDLQTNPLQMAVAYAAIANGGTIVTPHVGLQVDDAAGRVLEGIRPRPPPPRPHGPRIPGSDPRRPARRRAERRRDLVRRLRQLPDPGGGQDRHRRSDPATRTNPGTECSLRIPIRVLSPS